MYQVLARKYRPRNFNELVGQNHVSRALTSALERGRLHHAYLFTGTRGVGKTTIARILAKCLNCETGVTATPCEVCATCKAVNEGRFIDLIEIDAASRTKVEDTRELLDNVPYAPTQGRYKVYLIDEVHMLSTHSFNALLKTLEEPPEHVKFLFATTDPQKLPITVISRCLQFTLRPLSVDEITTHLSEILLKESITFESDAIWQIAEAAQGSLRDALSLTDQAIAYGQGQISHQDVKEMLGLIDRTIIYDLILAIHQNQKQRVSELLLQFRQQALDVSMVLDQLISTLHELALLQYLPELSLKYSAEINQKIMHLSQVFAPQDLQLYYQIACKGRAELQLAVTQEQGFEMCVLRLLAFRPIQPNEILYTTAPLQMAEPVVATELELQTPHFFESSQEQAHIKTQVEQVAAEQPSVENNETAENEVEELKQAFAAPIENQVVQPKDIPQTEVTFSITQGDDLFGLDDDIEELTEVSPISEESSSDDFLLVDGFELKETTTESNGQSQVELQNSNLDSSLVQVDLVAPSETERSDTVLLTSNEVTPNINITPNLMPQDILKLAEQDLTGEWTVDKWEFWFRTSQLSPAVQELAQYGVMQGQIDGESIFYLPEKYHKLMNQMQVNLESALKQQWSNTNFKVQYADIHEKTPYMMQQLRKEQAFNKTVELLQAEPIINDLVDRFDAKLENIQIKS